MKNILLTILVILSISSCSTQHNVNNFYNKYHGTNNTLSFKAPLFLASLMLDNDSEFETFRNKVKSVKVLTINDLTDARRTALNAELKQAIQRDNFENWFNLNRNENIINVNTQNRGNSLRNLLISMQGEDNLIFINAKTNLTESELTQFITRVLDATENKKEDSKEIEK